MMDIILEILIVFQDRIFGKKENRKIKPVTIILLLVFLSLIATLIINLYPLLNKN